jgi:hypothetical protein
MGCCNELATALDTTLVDPTQHVNFAKGMVLGVDDFQQEFAYLSGRDQWLVRDAIGYGTASGLRVFVENEGPEGPRLHVTAGSAFVPSGKQVCVGADQCAVINRWLAKPANAAIVNQLLNGGSPPLSPPFSPPVSPPLSPPAVTSGTISLFLTLCYQDCLTRPVPVPGEPCRSQDELMADSRIADDFRLELRKSQPVQVEEDALRDFVRWLRANVHVQDGSPPPPSDAQAWVAAMREAAQAWLDAASMSPQPSPPASISTLGDYLVNLSPGSLTVSRDQVCELLRAAFRFWVTELRPLWMARRCHHAMLQDQDCVLLARIELDVSFIGGSPIGTWQVVGSPPTVLVDERTRPFLVHLRLLQEWLMCGCVCGGLGEAAALGGGSDAIILGRALHRADLGGPTRVSIARITGNLTLDDSHHVVVGTSGTNVVVTLPLSVPEHAGRVYVIKNADATKLTVRTPPQSGDTIDDKLSLSIKKKAAVTLVADGAAGWQVVGLVG